jgi:hypothetical protein
MVVDPYKARKRYTVTERLDLIVSVKWRNPIRIFLNLSVIGGVCILTWQTVIWDYTKYEHNTKNYFPPKPKKLTQHHNCMVL